MRILAVLTAATLCTAAAVSETPSDTSVANKVSTRSESNNENAALTPDSRSSFTKTETFGQTADDMSLYDEDTYYAEEEDADFRYYDEVVEEQESDTISHSKWLPATEIQTQNSKSNRRMELFKLHILQEHVRKGKNTLTNTLMNIFLTCIVFPILAAFYFSLLWEEVARAMSARRNRLDGHQAQDEEAMGRRIEQVKDLDCKVIETKDESDDLCAICLDSFTIGEQVRSLKCKHLFHKDCIDRWLITKKMVCPTCKQIPVQANTNLS